MEDTLSPEVSVPISVFQQILTSANSSTLEETLDSLLENSRTVHGRSDLASKNILSLILQLTESLSNPSTRHLLFSSLKLLRNLCAGEIANQTSFIEHNGVKIVSIALSSMGFGSESDFGIVRMGLQLLGNVSLAGEEHQSHVWDQFFPVEFREIAKIRRQEVCDPLCMVIYTCCNGSYERVGELCGVQGLPILAEIIRTASEVGFGEDWLKLLLSRICFKEFHFLPLFFELHLDVAAEGGGDIKYGDDRFTTEQAFLLSILSERLNQRIDEITFSNDFALCILGILKRAVGVIDSVSRNKSGLPTGSAAIDVLGYSLTILRDVCAQDGIGDSKKEGSMDAVNSLVSSGLVELLLGLLRDLEPPEIIRKSIKQGENQVGKNYDLPKVCPYKGFRRDIVAVIGNCLYRKKNVQDEVRNRNGILLLMQQCATDEDNPFLREWGIWSVRNLLEDNADNQREVAELELQGSVDVPEIAGLGLRVEVDQKTRRAKLVNLS
ncbi:hypothetical protein HHK36_028821 [Tetracentron sinense]|uniref:Ataxin-10 domain-containing protein n=1 Tax=Tetracentron sinense TaxID=13715 RepID=A0A835D0L0_TETSI|nr:hypothetical protein HHK36_028821 [Tetracentron sinense]